MRIAQSVDSVEALVLIEWRKSTWHSQNDQSNSRDCNSQNVITYYIL